MILSLLCFSPHNLNQNYITWHQISLHLFKNHKLVPGCFLFFFLPHVYLFTVTVNIRWRWLFFWSNIYGYSTLFRTDWCSKFIFHNSEQNVVELNTNNTWLIFHHWPFSHFLSVFFFRVRYILFILIVAPWHPVTSMLLVSFKEAYMSFVTDIFSVSLSIPSLFDT